MYESNDKLVSHPAHYISNGYEVIDVIEAFTEGLEGIEASDTANIIKYACRWKRKGGLQDVEKVIWYATHLRDMLISKEKEKRLDEMATGMNYAPDYIPEWDPDDKKKKIIEITPGIWTYISVTEGNDKNE